MISYVMMFVGLVITFINFSQHMAHLMNTTLFSSTLKFFHSILSASALNLSYRQFMTLYSRDDHGTHVAGTIHMMAPDAQIYDYRVFGKDGFEIGDAIATSIYEACFDGCDIINMSLGGRWPSSTIRSAVQYAHSRGVIVVCAAGNEGDANPLTNERRYVHLFSWLLTMLLLYNYV